MCITVNVFVIDYCLDAINDYNTVGDLKFEITSRVYFKLVCIKYNQILIILK